MRKTNFRTKICAARVDLIHEVVRLGRQRFDIAEIDGARIVDKDVDAAERLHRFVDGSDDLFFVSNIDDERKRSRAQCLNFSARRVDRAWGTRKQREKLVKIHKTRSFTSARTRQLLVFDDSFRGHRDVGAFFGQCQRDCVTDSCCMCARVKTKLITNHNNIPRDAPVINTVLFFNIFSENYRSKFDFVF